MNQPVTQASLAYRRYTQGPRIHPYAVLKIGQTVCVDGQWYEVDAEITARDFCRLVGAGACYEHAYDR